VQIPASSQQTKYISLCLGTNPFIHSKVNFAWASLTANGTKERGAKRAEEDSKSLTLFLISLSNFPLVPFPLLLTCIWLYSPHINHGGVQNGLIKGNEFFLRYSIVIQDDTSGT